ncbi:NAD(P)H-dependent oxidoreductase [Paenibacillus sp. MWE-103]|uniref:NAD(P)H-dependent oxidoreductase n=1 Tax=Paenibacillus artemisiicola TaxID=1172618 RepID=A0ABS3WDE5_9BACL|nr:NAD(P)H-dependent oxidoreductase [Paenibacillus artemisiicola]MBO7746293.1 NAD(P)H-dependent oxidoreductase [Paenibacillus artemisiicola]
MNMLVVFAHPTHESLSHAFLQQVIRGSGENAAVKDVQVLDLYASGFDPVLVRRRDMHLDPELAAHREQLLWADKIVFVYPIWWGRPPAMLLGYIDRMFASGFAYRDQGGLLPEGLLRNKSVVCVSTMKGPPLYPLFWLNNAHKVLMRKALFRFVGIRKAKFFEFGRMETPGGAQARKLEKVYRYFKTVAG